MSCSKEGLALITSTLSSLKRLVEEKPLPESASKIIHLSAPQLLNREWAKSSPQPTSLPSEDRGISVSSQLCIQLTPPSPRKETVNEATVSLIDHVSVSYTPSCDAKIKKDKSESEEDQAGCASHFDENVSLPIKEQQTNSNNLNGSDSAGENQSVLSNHSQHEIDCIFPVKQASSSQNSHSIQEDQQEECPVLDDSSSSAQHTNSCGESAYLDGAHPSVQNSLGDKEGTVVSVHPEEMMSSKEVTQTASANQHMESSDGDAVNECESDPRAEAEHAIRSPQSHSSNQQVDSDQRDQVNESVHPEQRIQTEELSVCDEPIDHALSDPSAQQDKSPSDQIIHPDEAESVIRSSQVIDASEHDRSNESNHPEHCTDYEQSREVVETIESGSSAMNEFAGSVESDVLMNTDEATACKQPDQGSNADSSANSHLSNGDEHSTEASLSDSSGVHSNEPDTPVHETELEQSPQQMEQEKVMHCEQSAESASPVLIVESVFRDQTVCGTESDECNQHIVSDQLNNDRSTQYTRSDEQMKPDVDQSIQLSESTVSCVHQSVPSTHSSQSNEWNQATEASTVRSLDLTQTAQSSLPIQSNCCNQVDKGSAQKIEAVLPDQSVQLSPCRQLKSSDLTQSIGHCKPEESSNSDHSQPDPFIHPPHSNPSPKPHQSSQQTSSDQAFVVENSEESDRSSHSRLSCMSEFRQPRQIIPVDHSITSHESDHLHPTIRASQPTCSGHFSDSLELRMQAILSELDKQTTSPSPPPSSAPTPPPPSLRFTHLNFVYISNRGCAVFPSLIFHM